TRQWLHTPRVLYSTVTVGAAAMARGSYARLRAHHHLLLPVLLPVVHQASARATRTLAQGQPPAGDPRRDLEREESDAPPGRARRSGRQPAGARCSGDLRGPRTGAEAGERHGL